MNMGLEKKTNKKKVVKHNKTKKQNNKIILNDDLKDFLWNTFESRFQNKINLI